MPDEENLLFTEIEAATAARTIELRSRQRQQAAREAIEKLVFKEKMSERARALTEIRGDFSNLVSLLIERSVASERFVKLGSTVFPDKPSILQRIITGQDEQKPYRPVLGYFQGWRLNRETINLTERSYIITGRINEDLYPIDSNGRSYTDKTVGTQGEALLISGNLVNWEQGYHQQLPEVTSKITDDHLLRNHEENPAVATAFWHDKVVEWGIDLIGNSDI